MRFAQSACCGFLAIVSALLFVYPAWSNDLALGAKAKVKTPVMIPISPPVGLNWKTRDQVLELRDREVQKHKNLLRGFYEPGEVFDQIMDNKPWWGVHGMLIYGPGLRSIEGPSKESIYLLNPFRLVAAEPNNVGIWSPAAVTKKDLQDPAFPFYWTCSPVRFDAVNSTQHMTCYVSTYHKLLAKWRKKLSENPLINGFSLIAYNARDFGFNFMYLDYTKSKNVQPWRSKDPFEIPHYIHCGGSCRYPGGCNNMSPHRVETDENVLLGLPARAYIKLWRNRPRDPITSPADFVVVIDFV